jgi:ubiquinone/menaquinone biosynthesis C-methylase UbiE
MSNGLSVDWNLRVYKRPDVVSHYSNLTGLTRCEEYIFRKYLRRGMKILDIGVGGGRTVPYLTSITDDYVGADYSQEMVKACERKFPQRGFVVLDASDMAMFPSGTFDALVFSYNGMDNISPMKRRMKCLRECSRVIKGQGIFIFSGHNARALLSRPFFFAYLLSVFDGSSTRKLRSFIGEVYRSARFMIQKEAGRAFLRGHGYVMDISHGSLITHVTTPERMVAELGEVGFKILEILGSDYPKPKISYVTPWYYYVFSKREDA